MPMPADAITAQRLLADLVAMPTVAGSPNGELIDYAAGWLRAAGAEVSISTGARPDARNLHARLGPSGAGGLVLSAHTDVVSVQGQEWTTDPFRLRQQDGRVYGRGTADMKGFVAAVLAAVHRVAPTALQRPVHVVLSSDEEIGCQGIRPLLAQLRHEIERPWLTIVGEPTRLRVVDRHKGKLAFEVVVHGRTGHSAHAPEAVNAVTYAARLIVSLGDLERWLRFDGRHDERFAVPYGTVSIGPIHGGVSVNIVPDLCRFAFELRYLPGEDPGELRRLIERAVDATAREMHAIDPDTGVELATVIDYPPLEGGDQPPGDRPPGDRPAGAAAELAAIAGTGEAGGAVDFGTEAGLLQRTLGGTVVVCGPGDMAQGHRPDEYLELDQLDRAESLLRRLIAHPR